MSDFRDENDMPMGMPPGGLVEVKRHYHEWEAGAWGVILGVSRCKTCGEIAGDEHFPAHFPESLTR